MIAKEIRRQHERCGQEKYEKLIYGVLVKQRPLFIRLVEALISQLGNKDEKLSINFHFSHDINLAAEQDFAEVEIIYPAHYTTLVKQCCEQAINVIIDLHSLNPQFEQNIILS